MEKSSRRVFLLPTIALQNLVEVDDYYLGGIRVEVVKWKGVNRKRVVQRR
jgi:hypothetical protein